MNKRILIADDHYVVRLGTKMALESKFSNIYIDFAENYYEAKEKLVTERFDLIMLDIEMEGSIFKNMIKELKMIQDDIKIMIFSSSKENIAVEYIQEGAQGYLNKLSNDETIIKAIQSIFEEGYYYPFQVVKLLSDKPQKEDIKGVLSEREFQIFNLLGEGNGNLEIANILDIQIGTVGTYKKRIYTKLGIKNLIDLFKIYTKLD